jgi:O-antigen/teichoic acid export membrane protein
MAAAEARTVLAVLAAFGLLALQGPLLTMIARAMGRTAQAIAIEGTMQLVEGLAAIAIAVGGGHPLQVAIATMALRAAGLLAFLIYVRRIAPWLGGVGHASRQRVREMWRPAAAAMMLPLSQAGYLQGSAVAVGAAGGAMLVPVYTSLRTLSRIGFQAALIVVIPLMPDYAAARARGDDRRSALIVGSVGIVVLALGIGYALVLGVLGRTLLDAWTGGLIRPPQAMIALTAVAAAMSIVWTPLSDLLLAINRHERFAYTFALCAAAAVGLTLVLVRLIGVTGAAAAGLLLELTMLLTVLASLRRHGGPVEWRPTALVAALRKRP